MPIFIDNDVVGEGKRAALVQELFKAIKSFAGISICSLNKKA